MGHVIHLMIGCNCTLLTANTTSKIKYYSTCSVVTLQYFSRLIINVEIFECSRSYYVIQDHLSHSQKKTDWYVLCQGAHAITSLISVWKYSKGCAQDVGWHITRLRRLWTGVGSGLLHRYCSWQLCTTIYGAVSCINTCFHPTLQQTVPVACTSMSHSFLLQACN